MDDFLEKLKEAVNANPDVVFEIPVDVKTVSQEEAEEIRGKIECEKQNGTTAPQV